MTKFLSPAKETQMIMIYSYKKFMQNQLEEVIREKKKHSMTSNALATKKVTQ